MINKEKNKDCCFGKICEECDKQVDICPFCREIQIKIHPIPKNKNEFTRISNYYLSFCHKQSKKNNRIKITVAFFDWLFQKENVQLWNKFEEIDFFKITLEKKILEYKAIDNIYEKYHVFLKNINNLSIE
jgi:hypothetical protein